MMKTGRTLWILPLVAGLLCLGSARITAAASGAVPAAVERAALNKQWKTVIDTCEADKALLSVPEVRAILAQSRLASNHNDQSLELLLSLSDESQRRRWEQWTTQLVAKWPHKAVAHYFRGDAAARMGNWDQALRCYSEAIERDPEFAMAWNARGVAYAYLDNYRHAKDDLKEACRIAPKFADAHANLGTLLVLREAAPGALAEYDQAVQHSKSFALASMGKTIAMLGGSRDVNTQSQAIREFSLAARRPCVAALAEANLESLARLAREAGEKKVATLKGMSLSANEFRDMDSGMRRSTMGNMSYGDLRGVIQKSHENWAHSKSWGEAADYMGPFQKLVPIPSSQQSLRHAAEHRAVFDDAVSTMQQKYGVNSSAWFRDGGGADTIAVALEKSAGDMGAWPANTTRFGLMPNTDLPTLTRPGLQSKEK